MGAKNEYVFVSDMIGLVEGCAYETELGDHRYDLIRLAQMARGKLEMEAEVDRLRFKYESVHAVFEREALEKELAELRAELWSGLAADVTFSDEEVRGEIAAASASIDEKDGEDGWE